MFLPVRGERRWLGACAVTRKTALIYEVFPRELIDEESVSGLALPTASALLHTVQLSQDQQP